MPFGATCQRLDREDEPIGSSNAASRSMVELHAGDEWVMGSKRSIEAGMCSTTPCQFRLRLTNWILLIVVERLNWYRIVK